MKAIIIIIIISFLHCNIAERVRYDNHTLFKLTPKNDIALKILKNLEVSSLGYDFWTPVRTIGIPVDIVVSPNLKEDFLKVTQDFDVEVKSNNLQLFIDTFEQINTGRKMQETINWDAFHSLENINSWLYSLQKQHPQKVTTFIAGNTYEGRNITGVKISFSADNVKRGIFIEANMHAREWITNAVATYILNEVLTSEDETFRKLVESFDWYIVPVANPDGYIYSYEKDRMWRKTRVPYGKCFGADPNRNWNFHWDENRIYNNPCDDRYAGPTAFSEPSTKSLSQYITSVSDNLRVYICFHSYDQRLVVPYGHTRDHLDNYDVTVPLGRKAAKALEKRYGTKYVVGNIAEAIYELRGASVDWLKEQHHIPYVYAYELRDNGEYGFVLPPNLIIPTSEETLDSLVVILEGVLQNPDGKYYFIKKRFIQINNDRKHFIVFFVCLLENLKNIL